MTCRQCEQKISAFIEDRLDVKTTREMLNHIKGCPECYEELEVQLMVGCAQKAFSEDHEEQYDLRNLAPDLLQARRERVIQSLVLKYYGMVLGALILLILVLLLIKF